MFFYHTDKMKNHHLFFKMLLSGLLCLSLVVGFSVPAASFAEAYHWPAGPQITSEAAIVIDAETGTVLYEKNSTAAMYPASTTKLMTALLALENTTLRETVTVSHNAVYDIDVDSSRIWVDEGEEVSMEDALYALMLPSANDLAYAIAEHIGGTMPAFAEMMTARAKELGCTNTQFLNPHGLDEEGHYTCAADLAKIMQVLVKNSTFLKISGSKNHEIPPTNLCDESRWVLNTHLMIRGTYSYDGVIAGKTGHTDLAGANLVTCAKRGNMTLISVIMKAPDDTALYDDTAALLDYGFDNFAIYTITGEQLSTENEVPPLFSSEDSVQFLNSSLVTTDSSYITLPSTASLSDVRKSVSLLQLTTFAAGKNTIGKIVYTYGEHTVGSANLIYVNNGLPFTIDTSPEISSAPELSSGIASAGTDAQNKTGDSPTRDRRPLVISITLGCFCFFIGIYLVFVELPYRRKRSAYLKRKNRR